MEIKIVTAFLDIGRGDYSILSRSNDKYFDYFQFWARIRNDLTVYCQSENMQKILDIRKSFGLEDKTHIRCLDHFREIEKDMYQKMCFIEKNQKYKNFRYYDGALSNKADYDYVMCLKWWCLMDAAARQKPDTMMAWLDFGYNHGGERYTDSKDFDFLWSYEFPNKINAFCLCDPEAMCAVDSLQFQADCFLGHTAVMPAGLCKVFWEYMKEAMYSLIALDCIDDDQQLELMVYKRYPELFHIRICDWFEDMELCSNHRFKVRSVSDKKDWKYYIRRTLKKFRAKSTFIKRMKKKQVIYIKQ